MTEMTPSVPSEENPDYTSEHELHFYPSGTRRPNYWCKKCYPPKTVPSEGRTVDRAALETKATASLLRKKKYIASVSPQELLDLLAALRKAEKREQRLKDEREIIVMLLGKALLDKSLTAAEAVAAIDAALTQETAPEEETE